MKRVIWPTLAVIALAWPARVLGPLDGLPLNGTAEALLLGLVVPSLLWFDRRALDKPLLRVAIAALLAVKVIGLTFTPQGLCARFSTFAPFVGETHTIPIVEPQGWLRSWDVRADWRGESPRCTAIVDRSYASAREFPAWFINLVDSIRDRRELQMELTGAMRVTEAGTLAWATGDSMRLWGVIGRSPIDSSAGINSIRLTEGVHEVKLRASLTGDQWRLQPTWDGSDAWGAVTLAQATPGSWDAAAPFVSFAITALVLAILGLWVVDAVSPWRAEPALLAWSAAASVAMGTAAAFEGIDRLAALVLAGAIAISVSHARQNLRAAFLLVGVPWLAFFAVRALPDIGAYTKYTHDDWLAYQVAAYRIYMGGYWLEGGNLAFDYQPLYRWICGAVHFVFGDSSAGEIFLDAAFLLAGALVAFSIVKATAGFRWAVAAASAALVTYSVGTTWYFVGRGLGEIAAAGFGFLAAFMLLRGRLGRMRSVIAAGVFAGLMFYTRLNFLLSGAALVSLLLPLRVPARLSGIVNGVRRLRLVPPVVYAGVMTLSVGLFMTRTWWYTGRFSALYGTSLKNNDIGLRWNTIFEIEVWKKIGHSLAALVFMNEPPHFDPRALFVIIGTLMAVAAALQVPALRRIPAGLVLATLGMFASAFIVHTHNYPGRMTIPMVPFVCAVTMIGAQLLMSRRAW